MDRCDDHPPGNEELILQITEMLERLDRAELQRLVDHLQRRALAQVWARINRYNAELELAEPEPEPLTTSV